MVKGTGNIRTKQSFGDVQLHVEFATPSVVAGSSQGRGNSGVFLMGLAEVQLLYNYNNPTYADGMTGGVYGQTPPLVNAVRPPGEWQTYDIIFEAPPDALPLLGVVGGKVTDLVPEHEGQFGFVVH